VGAGASKKTWREITSNGPGKKETLKAKGLLTGNVWIVKDLIDAIEKDRQPLGGMYDGRAALEMIHAVYGIASPEGRRGVAAQDAPEPAESALGRPVPDEGSHTQPRPSRADREQTGDEFHLWCRRPACSWRGECSRDGCTTSWSRSPLWVQAPRPPFRWQPRWLHHNRFEKPLLSRESPRAFLPSFPRQNQSRQPHADER